MGKIKEKKWKRKSLSLSEIAISALGEKAKYFGKSQTQIVEDLILEKAKFAPDVEQFVSKYAKRNCIPRETAIERLLLELKALRKE